MRFGQESHCTPVQNACKSFVVQFEPIHSVWTQIAPQGIGLGIKESICTSKCSISAQHYLKLLLSLRGAQRYVTCSTVDVCVFVVVYLTHAFTVVYVLGGGADFKCLAGTLIFNT